eukprot:SAG11_NODE_43397_length_166_cov_69.597015_1_plen_24_part_10
MVKGKASQWSKPDYNDQKTITIRA